MKEFAQLFKVLALVLWVVAAVSPRVDPIKGWTLALIAAGLFFLNLPDVF